MAEEKLKIAVFIDFDNIEIGVKSTLNRHFDVGVVLEAIKERGEVVTKVAYGDWKRSGDYSRSMSQYAIHMVQRNLTPGGDKNGADINLALDALEMAFTRNHINTFVIVGGDSDFMALVEKLKQYDKKVFVVGGRSFTSVILQKNCHEFIAYENLFAPAPRRSGSDRSARPVTDIKKALPLVRRAVKILMDRGVSAQLGLLKSTFLQLDSAFSERDYGASTFREFIQKVADAGHVNLKQVDRSLLVEWKDADLLDEEPPMPPEPAPSETVENGGAVEAVEVNGNAAPLNGNTAAASAAPAAATAVSPQAEEAIRTIQELFAASKHPPRWPMYLRNVKQFLRALSPEFDERRFGFSTLLDLLRAAQRAGLFRLERNRQGILRAFPGPNLKYATVSPADSMIEIIPPMTEETAATEGARSVAPPSESAEVAAAADSDAGDMTQSAPDVDEGVSDKPAKRTRKPAAPRKRATPAKPRKKKDEPSE